VIEDSAKSSPAGSLRSLGEGTRETIWPDDEEERMFKQMVERNGLLIISMAVASLYWYFDSLHPGQLISRFFTFSLFLIYGVFTQYLINAHKAINAKLKEVQQQLLQRITVNAEHSQPDPIVAITEKNISEFVD
jgi:hypothetical protein